MTTTHNYTALYWLGAGLGLLWTFIWAWIWFMLLRMLRWKYLEMKHAPTWTAPPPPPLWQPPMKPGWSP